MTKQPAANPCQFTDCVIQEISIVSLAGPRQKKRFYYKHTKTQLTPFDAKGNLQNDQTLSMDVDNPGVVAPEFVALFQEANKALGTSLDVLLDATPTGTGYTTHAFGCADECDCVRKRQKITLPDGKQVDDPGQTIDGGKPRSKNAVPGKDQALAVVEKKITIPGKGTWLITFEIRLFGTVRRFSGTCVPCGTKGTATGIGTGTGKTTGSGTGTGTGTGSGSETGEGSGTGTGTGTDPVIKPPKTPEIPPPKTPEKDPQVSFWQKQRGLLIPILSGCLILCCITILAVVAWFYFNPAGNLETSEIPVDPTLSIEFPPLDEETTPPPTEESTPVETEIIPEPDGIITDISPVIPTASIVLTPTEVSPEEPLQIEYAFIGYGLSEIVHFTSESEIKNSGLVLGTDPMPISNATVTMTMSRPDNSTQTLKDVTDVSGQYTMTFNIFVYGDYMMTVDGVSADGYEYDPNLNLSNQYLVQVGAAEDQTVPTDRLVNFYNDFNDAFASGDTAFLFDALHPAVNEIYGAEACQVRLDEVIQNPIQLAVQNIESFGVWEWEIDGQTQSIKNTYTFGAVVTLPDNTTQNQTVHVALRDDASIGWFTDCGDPLE